MKIKKFYTPHEENEIGRLISKQNTATTSKLRRCRCKRLNLQSSSELICHMNYVHSSFGKQILMRYLIHISSHCLIIESRPPECHRKWILHLVSKIFAKKITLEIGTIFRTFEFEIFKKLITPNLGDNYLALIKRK